MRLRVDVLDIRFSKVKVQHIAVKALLTSVEFKRLQFLFKFV